MSFLRRWLGSVLLVLTLVAGALVDPSAADPTAERPYGLKVPIGLEGQGPVPLVVLLHGYTSNGASQATYFGLDEEADRSGFLLAHPDGTRDPLGNRFWNATDACCDFFRSGVDDVAYLDAVIDDIAGRYPVDENRVFLVGHSNGAFMAHRYACDRSERVAAIVTLAGMQWKDEGRCGAAAPPVSVLHVHGRRDFTIRYDGGATPAGRYPGAVETTADWATKNDCTGPPAPTGERLDLDSTVPGAETVEAASDGCPAGAEVRLWTIEGGGHVPAFDEAWPRAIWGFMATHPKVPSRS